MRGRVGRPGLMGTVARTAVIAGTATAVSGGMRNKQAAAAQAQAAAQQAEIDKQAQLDALQAQVNTLAAPAPAPAAAPAAGGDDLVSKLKELASLKEAGILSDAEFDAAKAKLIAG